MVNAQKEEETAVKDKINDLVNVDEADTADKEETVYIVAGADGSASSVTVSEWLRNSDKSDTIADTSTLTDIQNTNGDETYTADGTNLTWQANGAEIHYSGKTTAELPLSVKITYYVDGKETSAADMAGVSGHVKVRFDYTNNSVVKKTVDGKQVDIYTPFFMASGVIFNDDDFTNVTVSKGTVYNDGSRNIAVGFAVPGLAKSLDMDADKLPDYVEIEADTTDFKLPMTLTAAMTGLFNNMTVSKDSSLTSANDDLTKLEDAAQKLVDGSKELSDGASDLADGASTLSDGTKSLQSGLGKLSGSSTTLDNGAAKVYASLVSSAETQLNASLKAAGMSTVNLTVSNYDTVLTNLLDTVSKGAYSQAEAAAKEKITPLVEAKVKETVTAAVTEQVKAQVTEKVQAAVVQQLVAKGYTEDQAKAALSTDAVKAQVDAGVTQQMASDTVKATIAAAVTQQMATDAVKAKIEAAVKEQLSSDEVTSQLKSAVSKALAGESSYQSIVALKASLDSYGTFYTGLKTYTAGVDSAYTGSKKLTTGAAKLSKGADKLSSGAAKLYKNEKKFNEEGIQKLTDELSGDYSSVFDRLKAVADAGKEYKSFAGIGTGMEGNVKFIWRTDAIGE